MDLEDPEGLRANSLLILIRNCKEMRGRLSSREVPLREFQRRDSSEGVSVVRFQGTLELM